MMAGPGPVVKVAVPSWRSDVHGKADIVEEIVRIVGVDKVPMTPFERGDDARKPVLTRDPAAHPPRQARAGGARHGRGGDVVVHFETARPSCSAAAGPSSALANPIAADMSDMRPSLLPGLIAAAQANIDRGFPDLALFEVGQLFKGDRPEDQLIAASGVRHGFASSKGIGRHWSGSATAGRARRQGRCVRGAGGRRRADAGAAGRARRPGLAASRTFRHHPDRPAKRARLFRRTASARAGDCCAPTAR